MNSNLIVAEWTGKILKRAQLHSALETASIRALTNSLSLSLSRERGREQGNVFLKKFTEDKVVKINVISARPTWRRLTGPN